MAASYVLGIDLGQSPDATAVALLEYDDIHQPQYRLRALHRFPRGTPYTELSAPVKERITQAPIAGHLNVAVDATGPGRPVVDYFHEQLSRIPLYAITITGGTEVTGGQRDPHVPKRDLIYTTSLILGQRRLRIAQNMRYTEALLDELLAYRRTTSERGHDTYAAPSGSHDDLVLALSLALWTAENRRPPARYYPIGNPNRSRREMPTIDDILAQERRKNFNF